MAQYKDGREVPDDTPVSVPLAFQRPLSLQEEIKRYVRVHISQAAAAHEQETFEEADDFDVDEDGDLFSPYELRDAAPEWPGGEKDADADPPSSPQEPAKPEDGGPVATSQPNAA